MGVRFHPGRLLHLLNKFENCSIMKIPSTTKAPIMSTENPPYTNKAEIARAIFDEVFKQDPVPQRKDIVARVMAATGLSKTVAVAYVQKYRAKNGMVTPGRPVGRRSFPTRKLK